MPHFETFDGHSLFYDDQGDGEAVVLLHMERKWMEVEVERVEGEVEEVEVVQAEGVVLMEVEELERKFWALMRIMARKGLLTREEFTSELDADDAD